MDGASEFSETPSSEVTAYKPIVSDLDTTWEGRQWNTEEDMAHFIYEDVKTIMSAQDKIKAEWARRGNKGSMGFQDYRRLRDDPDTVHFYDSIEHRVRSIGEFAKRFGDEGVEGYLDEHIKNKGLYQIAAEGMSEVFDKHEKPLTQFLEEHPVSINGLKYAADDFMYGGWSILSDVRNAVAHNKDHHSIMYILAEHCIPYLRKKLEYGGQE